VPLHADLRGQLVLFLQPVRPHDARFLDADRQRFLHVHVQITIECPIGDERMRVVGRAADHGVEVFLVEAFPPIDVGLGLGKSL
jgi:hypothetical protein